MDASNRDDVDEAFRALFKEFQAIKVKHRLIKLEF